MKPFVISLLAALCLSSSLASEPSVLLLTWDYPVTPTPTNIVFDVWTNSGLGSTNWSLYASSTNRGTKVRAVGPAGFVRVKARDVNTGQTQDLNIHFVAVQRP